MKHHTVSYPILLVSGSSYRSLLDRADAAYSGILKSYDLFLCLWYLSRRRNRSRVKLAGELLMLFVPRWALATKTESITLRLMECTVDMALALKFLRWLQHVGDPLRTVKWEDSHRLVVKLSFCPFIATAPSLFSIHFSMITWSDLPDTSFEADLQVSGKRRKIKEKNT